MPDDLPEWFHAGKLYWDSQGRAQSLPPWPPKASSAGPRRVVTERPIDLTKVSGLIGTPRATLPKDLALYYVEDPGSDERWVPMSPVLVQVLTELAAAQGITLDWRVMPPTVGTERVMRRRERSGN